MSAVGQPLGTNPDAPTERAAPQAIRPVPDISRTRVLGDTARIFSHTSAPDSSPSIRSTSATCGS